MNKVKLIKKGDIYFLDELKVDGYFTIGNSLVKPKGILYDLSIKNCQAIENGYDLDELAKKIYPDIIFEEDDFEISGLPYQWGFKLGFLKCLELMGDKKFSEDDVKKIIHWSTLDEDVRLSEEEFFQSLQQTEWDVEIETVKEEYIWSPPGEGFEDQTYRDWREVPKLDKDGCLILKRI